MKRPSLREVTRMVRETHAAWSHPEAGCERATLVLSEYGPALLVATDEACRDFPVRSEHAEELGHENDVDAVGIARRLLAGLPR